MRVARSRWFSVAIATLAWSSAWPGGVLAQDTPIPFRPACALLAPEAVSAILGVTVTPDESMPDAYCSYLDGTQEVASISLRASPPLVLARTGLDGATDTTVGGVPALSSVRGGMGSSAVVIVGSQDGGTWGVQVERASGADSPLAAASALAEAIVASGPVTAHASVSTAEPLGIAGSLCQLITRAELKRLTGRSFADGELDVKQDRCQYRTKDQEAEVVLTIGAADLGEFRGATTRDLTVGDREAVFFPPTDFLVVDLGGGRLLGVRITAIGGGISAKDLPALRVAIAETAMGRMTPGAITCPLIATNVLLGASGLDLQPFAPVDPDWCWFVTPDQQTALILRIAAKRDVAYVRDGLRSSLPDLPAATALEVSGHAASVTTGAHGSLLAVHLDGLRGQDGKVLFAVLVGTDPTATDPPALLASVAAEVLAGL